MGALTAAGSVALPERLRELPATGFVGRVAECERLTELWSSPAGAAAPRADQRGGGGRQDEARPPTSHYNAHAEGATVLYGRCDEDLGGPYQPWVQALGHLSRGF